MSFLFIGSTGNLAGHSLLTWAIAGRLIEKGLRVGFMKPFGTHPVRVDGQRTDHDVLLFNDVLNLQEPPERLCPYQASDEAVKQKNPREILDEFKGLAQELSLGKDILLIMGSRQVFFDEFSRYVSDVDIVQALQADLILVNRYQDISKSIYSILSVISLLKERVKGIIINRVPPEKMEEIANVVIPSLPLKGVHVTVALPEDPVLAFQSLGEIKDILGGDVLWGGEYLRQPVGGMTVGSTDLQGELRLFKRAYNKIILLKPPSSDDGIAAPSAPRHVAGILLTGGRNPATQLLKAAEAANIPLLSVEADTFDALERIKQSTPLLSPGDEFKVRHFTELMDRVGALDKLLKSLNLNR